jgi:hypothetical protein
MTVITHLGHQPECHKYFSGLSFNPVIISLSCQNSNIASLLSMTESSSDHPEVNRALQAVAQNMLSPAFQAGDISTQAR